MKRFWDTARTAAIPGGFTVLLDERPVKLPSGARLTVTGPALAEAIAAEWQQAGGSREGEMRADDVPLTRLLGTALERIAPNPGPTVAGLAKYGETDLLCYRAEDHRLAALQAESWQPLLDWAALTHDAPLSVTTGLMPVAQPPAALAALRRAVGAHAPEELAALSIAVPALGSLVLGLALSAGRLTAAEAHALATLDETFQEEFWGADPEAARRRARIAAEIALAERFLALFRAESRA